MLISLVVSIAYLLKGGYKSDLYTDAFQFVIMFVGFIILFVAAFINYGDFNFLQNNLPQEHLNPTGGFSHLYLLVWFLIALWTFTDPGFHQRCYAAKNVKVAKWGIIISIFFWALFDFLTTTGGLYAKAILPNLDNPVQAFPALADNILGNGLKGLFFAALFATVLSTLNSFMFLSGITFGQDLFPKISKSKKISTNNLIRIGILIASLISFVLALFFQSVIEMWYLTGSLLIPGLIFNVLGSYFEKFRVSSRTASLELILGFISSLVWYILKETQSNILELFKNIKKNEIKCFLSNEADSLDCYIEIHAGAGGTESQDWAEMLQRMYVRWADKKNFKAEILTSSPGEEAGIKSALLRITGEKVFGLLKGEKGVHRLVRLSPFNSANLRHTSFALVEVIPDFQKTVNVEVNNDDLKIEAFKASGAGGQSVQKNSSAIRLTHKPSGIVVSVQNERSQSQNKNIALQILKSRLVDLENIKNKEKENELKGEFVSAEWGNQVRSYVLHPYTLVKDIRSGFELPDAQKVLDGDLDQLLFEFLKFINKSQNHN